jgi:hypothetical protein
VAAADLIVVQVLFQVAPAAVVAVVLQIHQGRQVRLIPAAAAAVQEMVPVAALQALVVQVLSLSKFLLALQLYFLVV